MQAMPRVLGIAQPVLRNRLHRTGAVESRPAKTPQKPQKYTRSVIRYNTDYPGSLAEIDDIRGRIVASRIATEQPWFGFEARSFYRTNLLVTAIGTTSQHQPPAHRKRDLMSTKLITVASSAAPLPEAFGQTLS
jgi:hypothetical protein